MKNIFFREKETSRESVRNRLKEIITTEPTVIDEPEVIELGVYTLEEHVERIRDALESLRYSIFNVVILIKEAHEQLGDDVFQNEFSDHLGMNPSTLSRWLQIGKSDFLVEKQSSLPTSFTSLYNLTRLEKKYIETFGVSKTHQKMSQLIEKGDISISSEISDIQFLIKQIEDLQRSRQKQTREDNIVNLSGPTEIDINPGFDHPSLSSLIERNETFKSFVIIPTTEIISKWSDDSLFDTDINSSFPLSEIRSPSLTEPVMCLIQIPMKDIEVGLKMLSGFGFTYRDTFVPNQPKNGYSLLKNESVIIRGERGYNGGLEETDIISHNKEDLLLYVERVSPSPYILVFSDTDNDNWTVCLD
jgi:hypothetical protein